MDKSKSNIHKQMKSRINMIYKTRRLMLRLPRVRLDFLASAHCEPKSIELVASLYLLNLESKS